MVNTMKKIKQLVESYQGWGGYNLRLGGQRKRL